MKRREFLQSLGLAAAAVTFLPSAFSTPTAPLAAPITDALDATGIEMAIGDVFTIRGYHAMNPITWRDTGVLQHFVVTAIDGPTITVLPKFGQTTGPLTIQPLNAEFYAAERAKREQV